MNVCLITGIFPPDIGGPATYVERFAHTLHEHHHQVCVITLGDDNKKYAFPVRRLSRSYPLVLRLFLLFWTLLRQARTYDVWYINGVELPAVLAGKLLRKRMVMKVVSDYAWERAGNQGLTSDSVYEFQHKPQHWKVELHKRLRSWMSRQVHTVITPSLHVKRLVCGWGVPESRAHLVYNAVEPVKLPLGTRQETRKKLGLPVNASIVVTVGRLIPIKRIDGLLRVFADLLEQQGEQSDLSLFVIGDGPEKNNLTELTRALNVTAHVRFIGQIEQQAVYAYLHAADVFVLNSSIEGFPHVVLEAMLVGTPVIATKVGGTPELVVHEQNGLLISAGNSGELRLQLSRMLNDVDLQQRCIQEGYQTARGFSWDQLFQRTVELLSCC